MKKKYRPANGHEGELFCDKFCANCSKEENCEIVLKSMSKDIDDPLYPSEWIYKDSEGFCTAFNKKGKENE